MLACEQAPELAQELAEREVTDGGLGWGLGRRSLWAKLFCRRSPFLSLPSSLFSPLSSGFLFALFLWTRETVHRLKICIKWFR